MRYVLHSSILLEGGIGYAKELLEKALGEEKSEGCYRKAYSNRFRFVLLNLSERQTKPAA